METFVVILVLIILTVLLAGSAWFFGREAGPGAGWMWLGGTHSMRELTSHFGEHATVLTMRRTPNMIADDRLHELAEEIRSEIERTATLGQEFEIRLQHLETELDISKQLPASLDARVLEVQAKTEERIADLRIQLDKRRAAESPHTLKRNDAVRDLYQKLAQIDVALGAVVNPMLLPGEPISVPETLYDDTLEWDNWGDVADRAYAFGEAFSRQRVVLDPEFADRIEAFITMFRGSLTSAVYPIVQSANATPLQKKQMRDGIVAIVAGITPLRREFERSWLQESRLEGVDTSDTHAI